MKLSIAILSLSALVVDAGCPFSETTSDAPNDDHHRHLRRRPLASLGEGAAKDKLANIIGNQKIKTGDRRSLIQTSCMTETHYDDIRDNIADMATVIENEGGNGELGHFYGGIVRLAAHDFMDFDQNQGGDARLGSDGCLDFSHAANAGLPDLWCDNTDACPFKTLYDQAYAPFMSRADFWVAAANAVVAETSVGNTPLRLPFRYGRVDRDVCPESSSRLPESGGCSEVEDTFINRMGVSWTDAVALMGAHTLGRGDENFSGHAGTWVQSDAESTIFDRRFYQEAVTRGWHPRNTPVGTDWTWGGRNRATMMLNTDICLRFDIPDGDSQNCCTNTERPRDCRDANLPQCPSSETVRPEAFSAFEAFRNSGRNNRSFYQAFYTAWEKATENGYDELALQDLRSSCDDEGPDPNPPDCSDVEGVELLSSLAGYEREKIAEALEEVSFSPKQVVIKEGEPGDAMFFVADGELVVTKEEEGEVLRLKKGQYFGELALLDDKPRAASVTAVGKVHCLKLGRVAFQLLLGPIEDLMKDHKKDYEKKAIDAEQVSFLRTDILLDDLQNLGTLGRGSFGHVTLVRHTKDSSGTTYALKAVSKQQIVDTSQQGHIISEKKVMSLLKHPFLIRLFATYKDKHRLYFLLEPSLGGELFTLLRKKRLFPDQHAKFYAATVVLAFEYMHSKNIVYRDLKPENLLLDDAGFLKVTDFGFAKELKAGKTWTLCGTPEYLAPEIVAGKGHGKGVDWWTVGVLIFEMLASYTPFYHEDQMHMYARIARGRVKCPEHFERDAKHIVKALLQVKPTNRLGVIQGEAAKIKAHAWFNNFDFDSLLAMKMTPPNKPKVKNNVDLTNFDDYGDEGDDFLPYQDDGSNWDKDF